MLLKIKDLTNAVGDKESEASNPWAAIDSICNIYALKFEGCDPPHMGECAIVKSVFIEEETNFWTITVDAEYENSSQRYIGRLYKPVKVQDMSNLELRVLQLEKDKDAIYERLWKLEHP